MTLTVSACAAFGLRAASSRVLAAALLLFLSGCVTVHIEDKGGEVRTSRHIGVLHVQLANPEQAVAGTISGVGMVAAPLGWSLGYTRQRWALIGDGCRAVVWLAPGQMDKATQSDLARAAGVCLLEDEVTARKDDLLEIKP